MLRVYELHREISGLQQKERSLTGYFTTLQALWEKLDQDHFVEWENDADRDKTSYLIMRKL